MKNTNNTKRPASPPLPAPTGSGQQSLLCRLAALYKELKQEERNFDAHGNDEGSCATYAAAERLREVVDEYIREQRSLRPNRLSPDVPLATANADKKGAA